MYQNSRLQGLETSSHRPCTTCMRFLRVRADRMPCVLLFTFDNDTRCNNMFWPTWKPPWATFNSSPSDICYHERLPSTFLTVFVEPRSESCGFSLPIPSLSKPRPSHPLVSMSDVAVRTPCHLLPHH